MAITAAEEWTQEIGAETAVSTEHPFFTLPLIPGHRWLASTLAGPGLEGLALRTLYGTGIRPAELLTLGPHHLPQPQQIALPDRLVPVEPDLWAELAQLSDRFFPWSQDQLNAIFADAAQRSGLAARFAACQRNLLPQTLRHVYATHRLERGMNLATLCFILGHASELTTAQYLLTAVALRGAGYAAAHPLMKDQSPLPQWGHDLPDGEGGGEDSPESDLRTYPATPSEEEIALLFEATETPREIAILRTFYASGMRIGEMIARVQADIEKEECRAFIRDGKGSKDRYCLLDPNTLGMLKLDGSPDESLFGLRSRFMIETMVRRLAATTGLDKIYAARGQHLSPHSFRHAFCTHLYLRSMNLVSLKRLMGHSYLSTTLIYTQVPLTHLQAAYANCHPLEVNQW